MNTIFDQVFTDFPKEAKLITDPNQIINKFYVKPNVIAMKTAWLFWKKNKEFYNNNWSDCLKHAWYKANR